jgi:hypothetical protein
MIELQFISQNNPIWKYSNPLEVKKKAQAYLGKSVSIFLSTRKDKKYMIQKPNGIWVHFGQMGYEDYTKHQDNNRRKSYLLRTENIKGKWKDDKYSPNNLSRNILW